MTVTYPMRLGVEFSNRVPCEHSKVLDLGAFSISEFWNRNAQPVLETQTVMIHGNGNKVRVIELGMS